MFVYEGVCRVRAGGCIFIGLAVSSSLLSGVAREDIYRYLFVHAMKLSIIPRNDIVRAESARHDLQVRMIQHQPGHDRHSAIQVTTDCVRRQQLNCRPLEPPQLKEQIDMLPLNTCHNITSTSIVSKMSCAVEVRVGRGLLVLRQHETVDFRTDL